MIINRLHLRLPSASSAPLAAVKVPASTRVASQLTPVSVRIKELMNDISKLKQREQREQDAQSRPEPNPIQNSLQKTVDTLAEIHRSLDF